MSVDQLLEYLAGHREPVRLATIIEDLRRPPQEIEAALGQLKRERKVSQPRLGQWQLAKEEIMPREPRTRTCAKCGQEKGVTGFPAGGPTCRACIDGKPPKKPAMTLHDIAERHNGEVQASTSIAIATAIVHLTVRRDELDQAIQVLRRMQ